LDKSKYISNKYLALVNSGKVINDDGQTEVIEALDLLYSQIKKPFSLKNIFNTKSIMGVYIYGKVGRGKSYLMDLFYQSINNKYAFRMHQHVFMFQVYEYMKKANLLNNKNPFKYAIDQLTKGISILCIDEFEVLDVADAMIIERLYRELHKKKILMVLTSNTEPNLLYKNGLQRSRFLPFIELINKVMMVKKINDGRDYRLNNKKINHLNNFQEFYFKSSDISLLKRFFVLLSNNKKIINMKIRHSNRDINISKTANNVAYFSFNELCGSNYSYIDYIYLTGKFSWFIISDIPKLLSKDRNKAKRFQTLLDILYDEKVGLVISSDIKPREIYEKGDGSIEFQRTVSRLYEMTNKDWLNKIKDKRYKKLFKI